MVLGLESSSLMNIFNEYFFRGVFLGIICLGLMIVFHEFGHYLWDVLITKVPSRFVFKRVNGRFAFAVEAELPRERFPEVRNNPRKFIYDRTMSRFAGIFSVIPALVFLLIFSNYSLLFFVMEVIFVVYSFYEAFFYHQEHPWIKQVFSEINNKNDEDY